jgi:hypothetical protein
MTGIAARFAGLAATALLLLAALGANDADLQPSARIVLVTAVVGLLAPLFWPGRAGTARATTVRIIGWSLAGAGLAAAVAVLSGLGLERLPRAVNSLAVLFLALVAVHALAAAVEGLLRRRAAGPEAARESAAWMAACALVTLGAAPLWLGPAAELALADRARAVETVVAVSPLTHLAVASGNDLLRNQWFYQHSNLAGLRFDYPRLAPVMTAYCLLAAVLLLVPAIRGSRPAAAATASGTTFEQEHRP